MSNKQQIQETLRSMGFKPLDIVRAFKVYEEHIGNNYYFEVIEDIITTLQNKDKAKLNQETNESVRWLERGGHYISAPPLRARGRGRSTSSRFRDTHEKKVCVANNYDGEEKLSHFIQITELTPDHFYIRLDVLDTSVKKRKYPIRDLNNDEVVAQLCIKKKRLFAQTTVDIDEFDGRENMEIAVYDNYKYNNRLSYFKLIKCPYELNNSYQPNCVDASTVIRILDKPNKMVCLYWNIPPASFGEIIYKLRIINIYRQDDDINEFETNEVELLPYLIPLSQIPISIQIITISCYREKRYLSEPSDLIHIGYDRIELEKEKNTLQMQIESEIQQQIDEKRLYRFPSIMVKCDNDDNINQININLNAQHDIDDILYDKHRDILQKWNENSTKLKTLIEQQNDDEIDEKRPHDEACFGVNLLDKYLQTCSIMNEQSNRLSKTTTKNYLLELINRRNALFKSVDENACKSVTATKAYESQQQQYEILKKHRIELQNKIELEFKQCGQMIEKENQLFQQLQQQMDTKYRINTEIKQLKSSTQSCVSVIKLYNDFMENNKKYIDKINADFKKTWSEFESKWMKWRFQDIIVWFKYKTIKLNTDKIDWTETEKQLEKRNITGKSLEKFNDLLFEFIGMQDFVVVAHLLSEIGLLKKKYNCNQATGDKNMKIPAEYLCLITKQIMRDPVIAFDGHCYDRSAIESYLKIHKKSPKTGASADYVIVFPNHKLKADIQQFVATCNIDLRIQQQNEGDKEGVKETAYM